MARIARPLVMTAAVVEDAEGAAGNVFRKLVPLHSSLDEVAFAV